MVECGQVELGGVPRVLDHDDVAPGGDDDEDEDEDEEDDTEDDEEDSEADTLVSLRDLAKAVSVRRSLKFFVFRLSSSIAWWRGRFTFIFIFLSFHQI